MAERAAVLPRPGRVRHRGGPDRVTVAFATLAAFLLVLALLASAMRAGPAPAPVRHVLLVRRIYRTTVVDDGPRTGRGGSTVSVSTSGAGVPAASPTTRTSPAR